MTITHLPYDVQEAADSHWYHEHYWKERALTLLLKHFPYPKGSQLLDFGCGRGEFLSMATRAGFSVTGLDMDPQCVELASTHGNARLISPDEYLSSMADASADIVTCFHVLEHVDNPKTLLREMRRVAKQYVLVAVPNLRCFEKWNHRKPQPVNEGHLQGWDKETLRNLAEKHCGLEWIGCTNDMTIHPSVSSRIARIFGPGTAKWFNLKILSRLWPQRCLSIIALFKVPNNR